MNKEIEQYIADNISTDASITDVISLRPGLGKSQFIIKRMSETLKSYNSGLVVVTDSVDRLVSMISGQSLDDDLAEFMRRNRHNISLLTADTFKDEIRTAANNHVIAITTQLFFKLKPSEINSMIKSNKYDIKHILIDEQPFIIEVQNIGIKQLVQIDEAINTALTNLTDQAEKQQMIDCFNYINTSLRKAYKDAERKNEKGNYTQYHFDAALKDNADTLFIFADKYKTELNSYNREVFKLLQVISLIADDGGMVVSQKIKSKDDSKQYNNYISAVIDYRKWYEEINTKIIVFDGTAKINPYYDTDYFNVIDCNDVEPPITNLTINLIDISASKTKLTKDQDHLQAIIDYLRAEPQPTQAIFTYKSIASKFEQVSDCIAHFGDIKGRNEYRKLTNITQIGLNRYPDHIYTFLCGYYFANQIEQQTEILLSDNAIAWYQEQGIEAKLQMKVKSTSRIIRRTHLVNFRNRLILSDIVQNIFRSQIRESNNIEKVTYNLIFGYSSSDDEAKANNQLIDLIRKYFVNVGATVNLIDKPREIREYKIGKRNNKDDSIAQKILAWIQSKPKGYIFTPKEIQKDLKITSPQFNTSIDHNKELKALLRSMRIKRGVYQI